MISKKKIQLTASWMSGLAYYTSCPVQSSYKKIPENTKKQHSTMT